VPTEWPDEARAGLDVPRTVITSDPAHAREFIGADEAIYKGLSGGVLTADPRHRYLPTTVLGAAEIDDALAGTAHLFEERVPKAYEVRLTVIGDQRCSRSQFMPEVRLPNSTGEPTTHP
jgi:hypothetical protein